MEELNNDKGVTQEESQNNEPSKIQNTIESLIELLKEANLNEIVDSFNRVKTEKIKSEELKALETLRVQNNNNSLNYKFWVKKFIKEFLVLLIILIAVCYLSYTDKIDACSTGTLLGSIIGYAIGNFNSSNKNN